MIFRNSKGELIEINKYDYPNDTIYYEKVMKLQEEFTKCKKLTTKNLFHHNTSNNYSESYQISIICQYVNTGYSC
jgi:hypothetical protein